MNNPGLDMEFLVKCLSSFPNVTCSSGYISPRSEFKIVKQIKKLRYFPVYIYGIFCLKMRRIFYLPGTNLRHWKQYLNKSHRHNIMDKQFNKTQDYF
jgi:hypothetical protein